MPLPSRPSSGPHPTAHRTRGGGPALVSVLVVACVLVWSTGRAQQHDTRPSLRVLFIGNSYTYFNNLGELLSAIARSRPDGPAIHSTIAARGGATLQSHLLDGPGAAALESATWDYVVLQEHSLLGGGVVDGRPAVADPAAFHGAVREFVKRIRSRRATPLLYMTWARRNAPADQGKLADAYLGIGRELDVPVAPVGLAFAEARRRLRGVNLHIHDMSHPTAAGSYLAAAVLYATLTGTTPYGAPAAIEGHPSPEGVVDLTQTVSLADLRPETAATLQHIAWDTVSASREEPRARARISD